MTESEAWSEIERVIRDDQKAMEAAQWLMLQCHNAVCSGGRFWRDRWERFKEGV